MISFTYPVLEPTNTIILRNPDYGDSEQIDNNVIFHIGMNNTVYSYKRSKKQTLLANFSALSKLKIASFEAFYIAFSGEEVRYVDPISQHWKVRIINNPLESVTTDSRGTCQLSTMTIQMRAEPISRVPLTDGGNYLTDGENPLVVI